MKHKLEGRNHVFFDAMGDIQGDILDRVEKIQKNPVNPKEVRKKQENKKAMWAAIACICLLGAAGTGVVRDVVGGGRITLKDSGGISGSFRSLEGKVYKEAEGNLFYTFEQSIFSREQTNITDFSSETDYFLDLQLDEGGTGYVMAVGGTEGNRGYILIHYDRGEVLVHQGAMDRFAHTELFQPEHNPYKDIWARHLMELLGRDGEVSQAFWGSDLGETITTEHGTAQKVTESGYWVQGYEVAPYTFYEAVAIAMLEMQLVEGYYGGGGGFDCPDWDNPYDFSISLSLCLSQEEEPIDLEAAHQVMASVSDHYTLEVYVNDVEIVYHGKGTTEYHTPRTIYVVEVTPEGREVTMEGEYDWMKESS